jgi:D-threo-aldose 1-dehydrogenase
LYDLIPSQQAVETVRHALDRGIAFFDTAPHYGAGLSEERLGLGLAGVARDRYQLATKVGRLADVEARTTTFDFTRDGVLRSVEASLERLGVDRIDVLHVHDPDDHMPVALAEAFPALEDLRRQGVIRGVGVGTNRWEVALECVRGADLDCLLLAGRYTLLEQAGAGDVLFPACREAGVEVILGGVYNSGILASGAAPGSRYNYRPASDEMLARVAAMEAVCQRHGVPLGHAAVQFALANPAVQSVVIGARSTLEIDDLVAASEATVPNDCWAELADLGVVLA